MNSRKKAAYFLAGIAFSAFVAIVWPFASNSQSSYSRSDWINIFVAIGTIGAVVVAIYISLRQEALRNEENHRHSILTLARTGIKIESLLLQTNQLENCFQTFSQFRGKHTRTAAGSTTTYTPKSAYSEFEKFIKPEHVLFSKEELVSLSHLDMGLALYINQALDCLERLAAYSKLEDQHLATYTPKQFVDYKANLVKLSHQAHEHLLKAHGIERELKNLYLIKKY